MISSKIQDWLNTSPRQLTHPKFRGCLRVSHVDVRPMSDQTIVIVSDIMRVTVTLEHESGEKTTFNALAKIEPSNETFLKLVRDNGIFETELMVYSTVLKHMEVLMAANGDTRDFLWPECYHCSHNKLLLQDLCEIGYRIVPMQDMLDVAHAKLVMEGLGRYHGMGLVLMEQGKIDRGQIPTNIYSRNESFINNLYTCGVTELAGVVDKTWGPQWSGVGDKLRRSVDKVGDKFAQLVNSTRGKCDLLCHGDFGLRNMLFKYDDQDDNTPISVKFIDFQAGNYSNLGFDLVTLLHSSMLPQVREENLETLLHIYSESLASTCSRCGYGGRVPTQDDVKEAVLSLGYFGMILALVILPISLPAGNKDYSIDLASLAGQSGDSVTTALPDSCLELESVRQALHYELKLRLHQNLI